MERITIGLYMQGIILTVAAAVPAVISATVSQLLRRKYRLDKPTFGFVFLVLTSSGMGFALAGWLVAFGVTGGGIPTAASVITQFMVGYLGAMIASAFILENRVRPSNRAWAVGIVPAIVVFAIAYLLVAVPLVRSVQELNNGLSCMNNLKQLGLCCKMYANEHQGAYPARLQDMYPEYITAPEVLVCPSTRNRIGDLSAIDTWASYVYVPGFREGGNPETLVCHDKDGNHTWGHNELYADGHVERTKVSRGARR